MVMLAVAAIVAAMMAVAGESASAQTYYSWCGYDYYGYYYCY